jgi:hypothetical protein
MNITYVIDFTKIEHERADALTDEEAIESINSTVRILAAPADLQYQDHSDSALQISSVFSGYRGQNHIHAPSMDLCPPLAKPCSHRQ